MYRIVLFVKLSITSYMYKKLSVAPYMMRNIRVLFHFKYNYRISALRAPVALAQRHHRPHTDLQENVPLKKKKKKEKEKKESVIKALTLD